MHQRSCKDRMKIGFKKRLKIRSKDFDIIVEELKKDIKVTA